MSVGYAPILCASFRIFIAWNLSPFEKKKNKGCPWDCFSPAVMTPQAVFRPPPWSAIGTPKGSRWGFAITIKTPCFIAPPSFGGGAACGKNHPTFSRFCRLENPRTLCYPCIISEHLFNFHACLQWKDPCMTTRLKLLPCRNLTRIFIRFGSFFFETNPPG